jgi:hypothetical protein
MADRKQTPDVLGEILGGEPAAPAAAATPKPKPAPRRKAPAKKSTEPTVATRRRRAKQQVWEYMEVVFRDYAGYRPHCVNGEEQRGWKTAPVIYEYLNQLGEQGWELVGVGGQNNREMPAYFKRPKT